MLVSVCFNASEATGLIHIKVPVFMVKEIVWSIDIHVPVIPYRDWNRCNRVYGPRQCLQSGGGGGGGGGGEGGGEQADSILELRFDID